VQGRFCKRFRSRVFRKWPKKLGLFRPNWGSNPRLTGRGGRGVPAGLGRELVDGGDRGFLRIAGSCARGHGLDAPVEDESVDSGRAGSGKLVCWTRLGAVDEKVVAPSR
jgi:hypothetical protein